MKNTLKGEIEGEFLTIYFQYDRYDTYETHP